MTGRNWTQMGCREFDTAVPDVQEALFPLPDPLGTPDLFDSEEE